MLLAFCYLGYDKESKDFKDIIKRNNSLKEIGEILNATASDCQTRWARLRERYSREKKLREIETRSGSGSTMRQSFPLYEQMNFLFKFVKNRKSITNILHLTSKQIHPIKTSESTEKLGSSNISRNQIRSSNENDIINKSPKPMLKTVNASATVASTNSSIPSALHSHSHSVLTSCSHNSDIYSQINMWNQCRPSSINPVPADIITNIKFSELCKPLYINTEDELILTHSSSSLSSSESFDSNDDFPSPHSPDAFSNNEIFSLLECSETLLRNKTVPPAAHSKASLNEIILSQLDRKSVSPALSLDSSSGISSDPPKKLNTHF